jgi:hypothetical protein
VINALIIFVGLLMVIFRRPLSRLNVAYQNKNTGHEIGSKDINGGEIAFILIGLGAILIAIIRIAKGA